MTLAQKAVFLDRDGVLNRLVSRDGGMVSPRTLAEFELFPWTSTALTRLADHGYELIVVTNQPDISRGLLEESELEKMHQELRALTPIVHIYVCSHDSDYGCNCRKPQPGLLLWAAQDLNLDLCSSWTIGDRDIDLVAGQRAGTQTVFIQGGQQEFPATQTTTVVPDLDSATSYILSSQFRTA